MLTGRVTAEREAVTLDIEEEGRVTIESLAKIRGVH